MLAMTIAGRRARAARRPARRPRTAAAFSRWSACSASSPACSSWPLGVGAWLVRWCSSVWRSWARPAGCAVTPATSVAMSSIPPERSGMASGIMSAQRALGSTAGFAIMGSILAVVVSATLPGKLETVIPDPTERQEAVDDIVDTANPRAVVGLIGPGKPISDVPASERRRRRGCGRRRVRRRHSGRARGGGGVGGPHLRRRLRVLSRRAGAK